MENYQYSLLSVSCFDGISNFVTHHHHNAINQSPKFDVSNAKFQFNFPTDLEALRTNAGMR